MTTAIHSNGSRWAGEQPTSLEELFDVLEHYALRRAQYPNDCFEESGAEMLRITGLPNFVRFSGNFYELSHVFSIDTDEPKLIARFRAAIAANIARPNYQAQRPYFDRNLVRVEPVRFSTTQGEAKLFYGDELLGQFADTYTLKSNGHYEGHGHRYWDEAAELILADRHAASLKAPAHA
jgi:hypothetical protein